jgi:UPF0716 protein FxsA
MPLLLLFLFLLLPIAEIYLIVQVGQAIGILPTLAILLLDGFVGAALARSQGRAAWARFNRALAEGRVPARETFDGAMIIVGGALLLAPGFITDAVGFLLLIPPTRSLLRGAVARLARRRVAFAWTIAGPPPGAGPRSRGPGAGPFGSPRRSRGYDYEGTAREVGDPSGELEPGERRE